MLSIDMMTESTSKKTQWAEAESRSRKSANPETEEQRRERFEALVVPVMNSLYRHAYRLSRNATSADDMVQETIFKAWKNFDRFQAGTRFRQWVFRIMTYHFFSELREARRRKRLHETIQAIGQRRIDENDGWSENPLGQWDTHADAVCEDDVKHAIDQLPGEQRSLLLLIAFGDHSYHDAAQHFNVPSGTIMSRLHRARQKVKSELQAYSA